MAASFTRDPKPYLDCWYGATTVKTMSSAPLSEMDQQALHVKSRPPPAANHGKPSVLTPEKWALYQYSLRRTKKLEPRCPAYVQSWFAELID